MDSHIYGNHIFLILIIVNNNDKSCTYLFILVSYLNICILIIMDNNDKSFTSFIFILVS